MYSVEYDENIGEINLYDELSKMPNESEKEVECEGFNIVRLYKDKEGRMFLGIDTGGSEIEYMEYNTFMNLVD